MRPNWSGGRWNLVTPRWRLPTKTRWLAWSGHLQRPAKPSLKLIIGAEIIPNDGPPVVLWATDRRSYANLSRLITDGRRRAPKGECWLKMDDIARYSKGLLAGVMPRLPGQRSLLAHIDRDHASYEWFRVRGKKQTDNKSLATCREIFGDRCYLLAELYHGSDDAWRIETLKNLSLETGLPLVAAGDVLYHTPARMPLHDVLTATKHHTTIHQAGDLLLPNAQRHLHPVAMRQQQFGGLEGALQRTIEIADRCEFKLDQLRYEYPVELTPNGQTTNEYLRQLTAAGARRRYPDGVPNKVQNQINHELGLIEELNYEAYFITVYDLVQFAKGQNILCHGRGSAANSAVCYCLEVTSVDPRHNGFVVRAVYQQGTRRSTRHRYRLRTRTAGKRSCNTCMRNTDVTAPDWLPQ